MPADLDDELAFDLLLQGHDLDDHPLTDFAEDVWVATDGPVPPASPALAALLLGRPPETSTVTSLAEERRPWRARTAARIAALGVAAKAAVAAAVAVTGVATAGATGLLPQPVEDIVLPVIELITPLDLGSNDTVDPPRSTGGDGANPTGGSGTGTGTTGPGEAGDQPGAVDGRRPGSVPATVQADGTAGSASGHGGTTPGEAGTVTSEPAAPLVAGGTPTSNPGEGPTTSTPPTTVEPTPTSGPPSQGGPRPTAGPPTTSPHEPASAGSPPAHTPHPPADHGPSDPHAGPPAHASGPPADTGRAEPTAGPPADPGATAYSARPEGRPDSPGTGERPPRPTASDGRAGGTNERGLPAPAAASGQHPAPAH
jgi:hypothetical protein